MVEPIEQGDIGPRRIVVGVDDSVESHAALRLAAREAELRGVELWMVHAYAYPVPIAWHTVPLVAHPECCDRAAEEMLSRIEFDQLDNSPSRTVRRLALVGLPADVLIENSDGADLLVVGGRAHSSVREVVMGSVTRSVMRHAHCPVVVVHATDGCDEGRTGSPRELRSVLVIPTQEEDHGRADLFPSAAS